MAANQLDVRATPEEVFDVLADGWSYAGWVVGAKSIVDVQPAFPAAGSSLWNRVRNGFRGVDGVTEVLSLDRPRSLRLRASVGRLGDAEITFELDATATGTLVTMREEPVGDRPASVLARRSGMLLRVRNAETLWRLKSLVEARAGHGPAPTSAGPGSLHTPLGTFTARAFAVAAVLRSARALHPRGDVLFGAAAIHPAGSMLAHLDSASVAVRLSRGIGLPHPFPDFNGVAVRFLDAHGTGSHQDLLLTAASARPVLRQVIRPSSSFRRSGYSSVLPHRCEDGTLRLFRCDPIPVGGLGDLDDSLPLTLELRIATPFGSWEPAATLTLDDLASEPPGGVRYDPWHTSAALTPAGFLNRLRAPAYAASRAATSVSSRRSDAVQEGAGSPPA